MSVETAVNSISLKEIVKDQPSFFLSNQHSCCNNTELKCMRDHMRVHHFTEVKHSLFHRWSTRDQSRQNLEQAEAKAKRQNRVRRVGNPMQEQYYWSAYINKSELTKDRQKTHFEYKGRELLTDATHWGRAGNCKGGRYIKTGRAGPVKSVFLASILSCKVELVMWNLCFVPN